MATEPMRRRYSFYGCLTVLLTLCLGTGCASKSKSTLKTRLPEETAATASAEDRDQRLSARVQAISRKNRILTLKFPDEKVAKIKGANEVRNFDDIGVGDTIKARFKTLVEVFPVNPTGKPLWPEIEEIKKAPKGTKPGTAILRPYEFQGVVTSLDPATRAIGIKGPAGKRVEVTEKPDLTRFNEIKTGDTVVARFVETTAIDITPAARPSTLIRGSRRR